MKRRKKFPRLFRQYCRICSTIFGSILLFSCYIFCFKSWITFFCNFENENSILNSFFENQTKLVDFPMKFSNVEKVTEMNFTVIQSQTFFSKTSKVSSPLAYLPSYPNTPIKCPIASMLREKSFIYYIQNVYVSYKPVRIITNDNKYYELLWTTQIKERFKVTKAVCGYKYLVFPASRWPDNYGHWLNEGLSALIYLPQSILDLNPVILTGFNKQIAKEHLKIFNIQYLDIINTKSNFVFGEHVFIVKGYEDCQAFGLRTFPLIRKRFWEYFNLTDTIPTNYNFINKKPSSKRYFTNMDEMIKLARSETGLDWRLVQPNITDINQTARLYCLSKVIVLPCGAIAFNCIFMKEGTGMVQLNSNRIDFPSIRPTYLLNIWEANVIHNNIKHYQNKGGSGDPVSVVKCIKLVLYAVTYQRWPSHDLFILYDFELITKTYRSNISHPFSFIDLMPELLAKYNFSKS